MILCLSNEFLNIKKKRSLWFRFPTLCEMSFYISETGWNNHVSPGVKASSSCVLLTGMQAYVYMYLPHVE
jgi:hypothetical protein